MGPLETRVREMFEVVINNGQVDRIEEYVEPGWVSDTPQGQMDVAGFKDYVRAWRAGFPDIHCEVYDALETDGMLAWRVRARGTHTGEFMGMPPTGRTVDFDSMNWAHGRNGNPTDHTVLMNLGAMMGQLGVPMGPTGMAALIQSGYEAFGRGDIPTVVSLFDPNITWTVPATVPILGGQYVGVDAVLSLFGKLPGLFSDLRVEPDRYLESGEDVVVLGHSRGVVARSGAAFEIPFAHCWTTKGGKATSCTEYGDSAMLAGLLAAIPQQEVRADTPSTTTVR